MEFLFIVFYASILGLVAPYVQIGSDRYGSLVPPVIGLATGSVLWILLTWLGFSYTDGWIWSIVMLGMPVAMFFGAKALDNQRKKTDEQALAATR
ncbi:MFS_ShiA_like domain containing protein [Microbacteriaceae bacterium]